MACGSICRSIQPLANAQGGEQQEAGRESDQDPQLDRQFCKPGSAKVRVGDEEFLLERNQSTYIPTGSLRRLENPGSDDINLIEVQCGDYFGEDDIVRLEDVYRRQ